MANTPTNDLIVEKLKTHYPSVPKHFADLWFAYWNDALGGNNGGVMKVGQDLYDFYGGTEVQLLDKAQRFWTNYVP